MVSECQRFDTPDGFFVLLEILLWVSSSLANVQFGRAWELCGAGFGESRAWLLGKKFPLDGDLCLPGQSSTSVKPFRLALCSVLKANSFMKQLLNHLSQ